MKLLVFSDSHGNERKMREALLLHKNADMLVFLGDGVRGAEEVFSEHSSVPSMILAGNCDGLNFIGNAPYTASFEEAGVKVFMTHGHRHAVKYGLETLHRYAVESGFRLALYGHTHTPLETRYEDGTVLFNPGSIAEGSYGIVYLERGEVLCSHGEI